MDTSDIIAPLVGLFVVFPAVREIPSFFNPLFKDIDKISTLQGNSTNESNKGSYSRDYEGPSGKYPSLSCVMEVHK
jgi:hypothetical protein